MIDDDRVRFSSSEQVLTITLEESDVFAAWIAGKEAADNGANANSNEAVDVKGSALINRSTPLSLSLSIGRSFRKLWRCDVTFVVRALVCRQTGVGYACLIGRTFDRSIGLVVDHKGGYAERIHLDSLAHLPGHTPIFVG